MQKDAADIGCSLRHKNPRTREASHAHRQSADVVLMRVRNQNRLNFAIADCFKIRQRILSGIFRVHAAIQQHPVSANLKIVRIRADLRASCEVYEFQMQLQ